MDVALRFNVTIGSDHRIELHLPDDMPQGPAEVIIIARPVRRLTDAQRHAIHALRGSPVALPATAPSSTELIRDDRGR